MVYFKNIAQGLGPVYNESSVFIEGFSSPLYTLLGSVFFSVFAENTDKMFLVWNLLLYLFFLRYIAFFLAILGIKKPFSYLIILAIAIGHTILYWSIFSLLETGLWLIVFNIFTLELWLLINKKRSSYGHILVLTCLCVFTRPESYLLIPIVIILAYIYRIGYKRELLNLIITWAASLAFLLITRYLIFGELLPNTYYAKQVPFDRKIYEYGKYLISYVRDFPLVLLVPPAILYLVSGLTSRQKSIIWVAFSIAILLPLLGGIDHFEGSRFYLLYSPIFIIAISVAIYKGLGNLGFDFSNKFYYSLVAVFIFCVLPSKNLLLFGYHDPIGKIEFEIVEQHKRIANNIKCMFGKGLPSVGIVAAGEFKYQYRGYVLDLVGLNHYEMARSETERYSPPLAHVAFSKDILFDEQVDLLLPTLMDKSAAEGINPGHIFHNEWIVRVLKNINKDEAFIEKFSEAILECDNCSDLLYGYFSNSYLKFLTDNQSNVNITLIK
ncbi:MAG: hypothetical protein Kapaf2KO_20070 [Candidatus Kapaibacteriales bacterium]